MLIRVYSNLSMGETKCRLEKWDMESDIEVDRLITGIGATCFFREPEPALQPMQMQGGQKTMIKSA